MVHRLRPGMPMEAAEALLGQPDTDKMTPGLPQRTLHKLGYFWRYGMTDGRILTLTLSNREVNAVEVRDAKGRIAYAASK